MYGVLLAAFLCVVVVVVVVLAMGVGLGALARRADRLDEQAGASRARARRAVARRGARGRRAASVVRLGLFHRTGTVVDQGDDGGSPRRRPDH